jgi:hypothetical protein
VFGGALGDLLPLAIGIAISPVPIIACILMLFSARARSNGSAFLVGWVLGVAVVTTAVVLLSDATAATDDAGGGPTLGDIVILLLGVGAILLGFRQWKGRPQPGEEAKLPTWMAAIDGFAPGKAFGFGFLLSALNPKNLGLAAAAGLAMEILFVVIASLSIAVPVVYLLVGGAGAMKTLDGWRTWLAANNAAVMAVLFIVIGAKLVGSGLDAFLA